MYLKLYIVFSCIQGLGLINIHLKYRKLIKLFRKFSSNKGQSVFVKAKKKHQISVLHNIPFPLWIPVISDWNFTWCFSVFYVAINFPGKYWKVWKFLRKMSDHFYVIRHITAAIYVLAGRLRIQVPYSQIMSSLCWVEISSQNFTEYFFTSHP